MKASKLAITAAVAGIIAFSGSVFASVHVNETNHLMTSSKTSHVLYMEDDDDPSCERINPLNCRNN